MLWETGRPKASSDPPKVPVSRSWRCVLMNDSVRREYYQATSGSRSNWLCQETFVYLLTRQVRFSVLFLLAAVLASLLRFGPNLLPRDRVQAEPAQPKQAATKQ